MHLRVFVLLVLFFDLLFWGLLKIIDYNLLDIDFLT
jgi:hypothetical protein